MSAPLAPPHLAAAFLSMLASAACVGYDPTLSGFERRNGTWVVKEQGCPADGTNHPEANARRWAPILPAPNSAFDVARWAQEYERIMKLPDPLHELQALKARGQSTRNVPISQCDHQGTAETAALR